MMALLTNWKTQRRQLMLLALTLYLIVGLVSAFYLQPVFDEIKAVGYRDEVDLALQSRAATWYATDWAVWSVGLVCGIAQLLALIRPVTTPTQAALNSPQSAA
jgi:hypothetical protein